MAWAAYAAKIVRVDLVVGVEPVAPERRHDDHAVDGLLVEHRHDEHRFGLVRVADDEAARVARRVAQPDRAAVLGDPAGQALRRSATRRLSSRRRGRAEERALEGERLAHAGRVVDPVDPDRVVLGQALGLGHDGRGDRLAGRAAG